MSGIENKLDDFVFMLMMNQILSILLSFILLTSHMSLTIGTHFCGGEAVKSKIILGETHLGCSMMDEEEPCHDSDNSNNDRTIIDKTPCCENQYQIIQSTNEFVKDAAQIAFNVEVALSFTHTTFNFDISPKSIPQFFSEHNLPPLSQDIQVLFQTFLI